MNITLRKANALQQSIQDIIRQINVESKIELNEFEDPEIRLANANGTLIANDCRRFSLTKSLYEIRMLIGRENANVGINDRLSHAAFIDKRIGQLSTFFASSSLQDNLIVINGQIQKLKSPDNRGFGYNNSVSTGILTQTQVDIFKTELQTLKKEKQKLNDEILELNVRTEIILNNEVVDILSVEGLL